MNLKYLILGFALYMTTSICNAQDVKNVITDGLRFCESTYPLDGKLLIANFGSEILNPLNNEGKGYILSYSDGTLAPFISSDGNLSAPKGMFEKHNCLYICDVNKIVVYDLNSLSSPLQIIHFPELETMLNGITGDDNWIYVSVTNTGNIYRFKPISSSSTSTAELEFYTTVSGANGLLLENNVLYVASSPIDEIVKDENRIYKISDIQNPVPEPLDVKQGKYDGLAIYEDSILYASNWEPLQIIAINLHTKRVDTIIDISDQIKGAAAISIYKNKLYIPDLPESKVFEFQIK